MTTVNFSKIRDVKLPERATSGSAGIDFFVPEFNFQFRKDFTELNRKYGSKIGTQEIAIPATCRVLIPSGIKYLIPNDYALVAMNKSGIASSIGLTVGACVCDSDYQGEYIISLINTSDMPVRILSGSKIVQMLLLPVPQFDIRYLPIEDLEMVRSDSERGEGGFGSTGK